ncbi:MAG: nascent polypeptide-associated complex protein [Candidatus Methanospirareceae archaeon]
MKGGIGKITSPKKIKQMMRQFGISMGEIKDVEEVIIRTTDADIVFKDPVVTVIDAQGSKMYQIIGTPEEHPKDNIPKEDIELVMEKVGCSEEEARAALIESKGDLVEAITKLSEK